MIRVRVAVLVAAALAVGAAGAAAQGQRPPRPEAAAVQQERHRLEEQVRARFLTAVSRRLGLEAEQRDRLRVVLEEGAASRRELARQGVELRRRLMDAVQDGDTPMATFQELLGEIEALRRSEQELERAEDERLAGFLDPRQRAMFLMMRMRFNEQVRAVRGQRGDRGRGGGGGPPGGWPR